MQWIQKCLDSLERSSVRPSVICIDNGSTDDTIGFVRSYFPKVRLVESSHNLGFGAANNMGFKVALAEGYDFVYLLNQDAWVGRDTIELLIKAFRPSYGVLSPIQNDAKGRLDKNFSKHCSRRLRVLKGIEADESLVVEVPFVMAAHWLLSRKAIETVGGFSPAFQQYGEDDNYLDRLHYHGLKCGVVPAAKAVHDRAGRKITRKARIKLKCVSTVVRVSDPNSILLLRKLSEPLRLISMGVKNFSGIPFQYIPVLTARYRELSDLRRESKKKRAFL